jgi:hypothetical protein
MDNAEKDWRNIYKIGGITTIIVLCGIVLDMVIGTITGEILQNSLKLP